MPSGTKKLVDQLLSQADYLPRKELAEIKRAIDFAAAAHLGQKRRSGEPYLHHLISTGIILTEIRIDAAGIIAGILHDTLEDTDTTIAQIKTEFGPEIAKLVDGVTKVSSIRLNNIDSNPENHNQVRQLESLRKLFLAMAKDVRVVLIKLADRLHNMRTLQYVPVEKQNRIAKETMEVYVPLANRLGIWQLKSDLEDHCFKYLYPQDYLKCLSEVESKTSGGQSLVKKVIAKIKPALTKAQITDYQISGRTKNLFSIYQKTIRQNKSVDQIYDIFAVRIITHDIKDCYGALGVIHNLWKPIPGRFKDYIASPKPNGYQSLHTSVFALDGQKVEIQIRTEAMHNSAEFGITAHWLYKEKGQVGKDIDWVKELSRVKNMDLTEMSQDLKLDLFEDRIFVYTPKGDVKDLPLGATPIDFAYLIHTDIGHALVGAKINQKIVPLDHQLQNGDIIEIMTSKAKAEPKRQWIEIAKTNFARSKIKSFFKKENYDHNLEQGRVVINQELGQLNLLEVAKTDQRKIKDLLDQLPYKTIDDLLVAVASGDVSVKRVVKILYPESEILSKPKTSSKTTVKQKKPTILFGRDQRLDFRISANCCHPVEPKPIVGYITRGYGITVHELNCKNVTSKDANRLIAARWEKVKAPKYSAKLQIICKDRLGMLYDITKIAVQEKVNMADIQSSPEEENYAKIIITVNIGGLDELSSLIGKLKSVPQVQDVKKIP